MVDNQLSILGLGAMRITGSDAEKTVRYAIDQGINFIDTAYIYQNGKNEEMLGRALMNGYRKKVFLATKLPLFLVKGPNDFDKFFNTSRKRLKTNYIDYYLLHMLGDVKTLKKLFDFGLKEWFLAKKDIGEIRNIGFSFHGSKADFIELIDYYRFDFCMVQYNYLDEYNQAGIEGIRYAADKNIPVLVMEPLRGGLLVKNLPSKVKDLFNEKFPEESYVSIALRYPLSEPTVSLVLSGMRTITEIDANLKTAENIKPLTDEEFSVYGKARELLLTNIKVDCTGCGYCLPTCPKNIDIISCFNLYNEYFNFSKRKSKLQYMQITGLFGTKHSYASLCIQCKKCEPYCPQKIIISEQLMHVKRKMEKLAFKIVRFFVKFRINKKRKEKNNEN